VLGDVHPETFLALGHAQRCDEPDQPDQDEGPDEGVDRRDEDGDRLVEQLRGLAEEEAVADAVRALLRTSALQSASSTSFARSGRTIPTTSFTSASVPTFAARRSDSCPGGARFPPGQ
jgi:hypothetical protein